MVKLRRVYKESLVESKKKEVVNEIDSQKIPFTNWKDPAMQAIICAEFDGMQVDQDKTTEDTLIFTYEDYPCSLKFKGYMLSLDMDTSDNVPPAHFPVEDKPNLSVQSLIQTIKTVFKKRTAGTTLGIKESFESNKNLFPEEATKEITENTDTTDTKEVVEESADSFWNSLPEYTGADTNWKKVDLYIPISWFSDIGSELSSARAHIVGVAVHKMKNGSERLVCVDDSDHVNTVAWDCENFFLSKLESQNFENYDMDESHPVEEEHEATEESNESDNKEKVEENIDASIPTDIDDPIPQDDIEEVEEVVVDERTPEEIKAMHDIAMEYFLEDLANSVMISMDHNDDIVPPCDEEDNCGELISVYLSPSYAMNKLSDIIVPVYVRYNDDLKDYMLSLPAIETVPEPLGVFNNADYPEDAAKVYDTAVQNYLLNDVGYSDVMPLNTENVSEVKARVVDFINGLAEDYQNKKSNLNSDMQLLGESLLKESRYYIVPDTTDLSSDEPVNKLNHIGYTDLDIAKSDMAELMSTSKYPYGLKILDTNFSSDKEDWELL